MAIRIQTDQTLYLYEDEGDTIFPSTGDWSILWMYRHESDLNVASLLAVLYGDVAATVNCGTHVASDGVTVTLRGANGGAETVAPGTFVLEVGREYRFSLVHDSSAGTVTFCNDGVPLLGMSFSPAAGDAGFRSLHFAGYGGPSVGSPPGNVDSTWARMRIWTDVLTEAEQKAEFRSFTTVRTADLVNDWPMVPGADRFDPASGTTQVLKIFPTTSIVDGAGFTNYPAELLYRDSESGGDSTLSISEIDVPAPATVEGDHEVLWISAGVLASSGAAPTIATPAGWTLRGTGGSVPVVGGAVNTRVHLFTRLAPSSNGPVTCDAGVNAVFAFTRLSYPNPDAATPFGQVIFGNGGPSTSAVLSALTTGRKRSVLSSFITQGAAQSITPPAGMVEREDNATRGASSHDAFQAAAGSSGTKTFTLPSSTDFAWGFAEFYSDPDGATDSGNNTAQASWAVSHPAAAAGDLLTFNLGWDDSTTISSVTAPAGPNGETATLIAGPVASSGTEVRAAAWRYVATDDWEAGTLAFAPVGGSEQWTATVIKVPAGEFDATTPIGAASTRASAGTAESSVLSPAFSVGATDGGGRLVAWLVADDDPFTTYASAWTKLANVDRGAVAGLLAQRDLPTADSESVTAGTWTIASDSWCSLAYVIRQPVTAKELTAQGAAVASATAALALAKAMAAQGAGLAAASAGLQVVKPLTAAALAAADSDAELQVVTAPVELQANAAAVAAASASLLKGAALTAAGVAVVSSGASMAHAVPVHASGAALAVAGADLAVAVTLGGAGLAQAAAIASLHLSKALAAAGAAQAGGAAALATSSSNDLAASGGALAQATAVLSVLVTLSAQAVAQAQASATVGLAKPLGAAGGAQADGDAGLIVSSANDLIALGVAGAQAAASLWLDVPLNAAALAQAGSGGVLTLTVPLRAAALGQASATAQLSGAINLAAAGGAGSSAQAQLQVLGPVLEYSRGMRARNAPRHWRAKRPIRSWRATP